MASAKFLEEALSTDVDESAVNAIVGSLENQLVTSTPTVANQQGPSVTVNLNHTNSTIANGGTVSTLKHGVTNGGSGSMNILNSDLNKPLTATPFQTNTNVVHTNVVNTVASSLHGGVTSSGFGTNSTTNATSQSNFTQLTKPNEPVKIVYPSGSQQQSSPAVVNLNNRVTFQTTSLPNGNLGLAPLSTQNVLNAVTTSNQSVVTSGSLISKQIGGVLGVDHGKQTLVLKAGGNTPLTTQTLVSVPMTISAAMTQVTTSQGLSSIVTLPKPVVGTHQTLVNNPTTILPANVQLVNVNAVRAATPGQQGQKTMAPRVVLGTPQLVGARPGQPGQITLQTLQGLQAGTQGHLLLKTENGQYQLLRVGPPPTTQGGGIVQNSQGTHQGGPTFRLQTMPTHGTVTVATTAVTQTIQSQPPALTTQTTAIQRHNVDTTKEKCRKFLANLLELSSREPKAVERNVRTLIQELIDTKVEPEEFCDRLERLLNASPQPCLIGFLKKSLPLLRQSLVTKELVIDGIRPPPASVLFLQANTTTMVPNLQPQLRPQQTQVRVMAPGQTFVPRLGQTIQHRVVTPIRTTTPAGRLITTSTLRPQNSISIVTTTTTIPSHVQAQIRVSNPSLPAPPLHVRQQPMKTTIAVQPKTTSLINAKSTMATMKANAITKPSAPSLLPKPTAKEKEKKSFHSAGYTGDDDINDVAAMGGVNLAEETQRILGSTEFVGRQIRSCKDEIFLHSTPLQQRIKNIVAKHGLEEPGTDVAALISHATQERLKNIVEKLGVMAEHRIDFNKADSRYEVAQDVKGQLKFLEELDRAEMKRHEEQEREMLWRAAKSRSKSDDPEQAKLKAKAKEIQRAEMEEVRQREANLTALQAIGSRTKKSRLDSGPGTSTSGQTQAGSSGNGSSLNRTPISMRPRVKRVNLRDLLFLLEQEKDTCRSTVLYKSFLK